MLGFIVISYLYYLAFLKGSFFARSIIYMNDLTVVDSSTKILSFADNASAINREVILKMLPFYK